ncbi:MAG: ATP-binding protein [Fusobacteriaceae bacterium]|nr:ATP-binding protein [Fusobacteriaceae bacterium]
MIKREHYLKKIRPFIGTDLVKVITGIRRSGKSVMLDQIREEIDDEAHTIFLNFELFKNAHLLTYQALHTYVDGIIGDSKEKWRLFFDEIQDVADWEKAIRSLRVTYDADIYITGSNAKLLSGELSSYLGGRYAEFVIYPFSYAEFLQLSPGNTFERYITWGGFPFLDNLPLSDQSYEIYLRDIFNSILLKDVARRYKIRDVDLLQRIVTYVLGSIGREFSATSLSKYFKSERRGVSTDTIINYIKACEDAFLFYHIKDEDVRGKDVLKLQGKYYVADHGLRQAIYGRNRDDIAFVLENIVCMELFRRGYQVTVGKNGQKEIDFVAKKGDEQLYVQVTYLLASSETREREFGAFKGIDTGWPRIVLSLDELDMSYNGFRHMNLKKWLTEG